jgi:cytochrome c biogenesis protein
VVYLGCLLLVMGIFAMFYIRERRIWVWVKPGQDGSGGAHALMAMSTQRRTLDFEREFDELKTRLPQSA